MSYSRMGWDGSQVYVYAMDNALACGMCSLSDGVFYAFSTAEMVAHLEEHKAAEHVVPDDVIPALRRDDAENFEVPT